MKKSKTTPHLMTMEEYFEFATGNKKGLKINDEKTVLELINEKTGNKPRNKTGFPPARE
jgi:hypothetical protein